MRVLVVDDNPVDRERLRRAFRSLATSTGLEIEVAECQDGQEALAVLDADPPDLVVTDLSMPGFATGYQVEQVARRRGIRVEVMSGLPPLSPHWAERTRSKDRLDWLREVVCFQGERTKPAPTTGPLRRVLMAGAGAAGVLAVAALSGWM